MPEDDVGSEMVRRKSDEGQSPFVIACLVIFIFFLGGWGFIGFYGFTQGDPQRLLHPTDSDGQTCGVDETVKDKPFLFYFDITQCTNPSILTKGCRTPQVCVKACPSESFVAISSAAEIGEALTKTKLICKKKTPVGQMNVTELVDEGHCARYYLQSELVISRCIPSFNVSNSLMHTNSFKLLIGLQIDHVVTGTISLAQHVNVIQMFDQIFQDYSETWWIILIGLAISMFISFLWIVLLRISAGCMVWLTFVAILALQGFSFWYCLTRFMELKEMGGASNQSLAQIAFTTNLETYLEFRVTWLAFAIILGISVPLIVLVIIWWRKQIFNTIRLINLANRAIGDIMSTLVFPIIPWLFQVFVIGYFAAVALYLASIGKFTFTVVGSDNMTDTSCNCSSVTDSVGTCIPLEFEQICDSQCPGTTCRFLETQSSYYGPFLQFYNLFGLLWGLCFVSQIVEAVLVNVFIFWYWEFDNSSNPQSNLVTTQFLKIIVGYLGRVVIDSLTISIINLIRVLLSYLKTNTRCNRAIKCLSKCRFCTKILGGENLHKGMDEVTIFILFLGQLVIVTAMGMLSFIIFTKKIYFFNEYIPPTNYYLIPVITTVLGAYFISGLFINIFSVVIKVIHRSFSNEKDKNDEPIKNRSYGYEVVESFFKSHHKNLGEKEEETQF